MTKKAKLSPTSRKMLEQARTEAHQRVIKHGIVQFQANEKLMDSLLRLADQKQMPLTDLVRQIVINGTAGGAPKSKKRTPASGQRHSVRISDSTG